MWRACPAHQVRASSRVSAPKHRRLDEARKIRPADLLPALAHQTKHLPTEEATMEILAPPAQDVHQPKAAQSLRSLRPLGLRWAITEMSVEDSGRAIAAALQDGKAVAIGDDSFEDLQGKASFVVEGIESDGRLVGASVVPGDEVSQSPRRSELGGVAGALEASRCLRVAPCVTDGPVTVSLDGEQAAKEALGNWPLDPNRPDCDVL